MTLPGIRTLVGRQSRLDLTYPCIMGILNVTPDSFSDGGCYLDPLAAVRQGLEMQREGAGILDVGGESTRPGACGVSAEEELSRVIPVIEGLRQETSLPISIDTSKAVVAREAIASGANFINDISGLTFDPEMAAAAAGTGAGLFLMHTRGRPEVMQRDTGYRNLLSEVMAGLRDSVRTALDAGVPRECLAVDPGIGFGKDAVGNLQLLSHLDLLHQLDCPVLLGTSRKSFIGQVLGREDPRQRLSGTLATVALGVARGVQIFRVHDVAPARDAALMAWAVREQKLP